MNIYKAIERAKNKLIKKAQTDGIYENFGQKEYRKLKEKYDPMFNDDISIMERNRQLAALESFSDWCGSYTGR